MAESVTRSDFLHLSCFIRGPVVSEYYPEESILEYFENKSLALTYPLKLKPIKIKNTQKTINVSFHLSAFATPLESPLPGGCVGYF